MLRGFRLEIFDSLNVTYGQWEISKELRSAIFCHELSILLAQEFDMMDDSSRHFIGSSTLLHYFDVRH